MVNLVPAPDLDPLDPGDVPPIASLLNQRFRGFLPVVVDVETGGFHPEKNALLEIALATLKFDENCCLVIDEVHDFSIAPAENTTVLPEALAVNKINLADPERNALSEAEALRNSFQVVRRAIKAHGCNRAVLVGHNATFDLSFVNAACARSGVKRNPFHPFSVFDTASLAAVALGHTVLAKAVRLADIPFDASQAHNARYDTVKTAELFCYIVNTWQQLGGWDKDAQRHPVGGG